MQRILIPLALEGHSLNETAFVRSTYLRPLFERGLFPLLISPNMPWSMVEREYSAAAGLLLLGGSDISPSCYGQELHPATEPGPEARDRVEIALIRKAVRDRKPLLGICRGCQLLAVALGGTLYQHIEDHLPSEQHTRTDVADYGSRVLLQHEVVLVPGTRIARICGDGRFRMNSAHHQSICETGPALRVTGRSPAGCIEFVEHVDEEYFCLGVQAHPEAMTEAHARRIFSSFADTVGSEAAGPQPAGSWTGGTATFPALSRAAE